MKNRIMKLAQALSLLALVGFGSSAYADPIVINFSESNDSAEKGTFETGGYTFTGVKFTNGQCAGGPCILLNATGDTVTLQRTDGEDFDLVSFFLLSTSEQGELTINGTQELCTVVALCADPIIALLNGLVVLNGTHFDLTTTDMYTFSNSGNASLRIDNVSLFYDGDGGTTVPEPGTLGLLGLGLLGLGLRRRSKV